MAKQSRRHGYAERSAARWIGDQKKLIYFFKTSMAPSIVYLITSQIQSFNSVKSTRLPPYTWESEIHCGLSQDFSQCCPCINNTLSQKQ